jgi:adenine-specific DNA-methyltransferase
LADLLLASNRVANISGTYGCFLRSWQSSALKPIELRPREFSKRVEDAISSCLDVYELVTRPNDVVYLDPPYTKRQYAAYYHILETICVGDQPLVTGKTGLRPWKHLASVFCYKRHALEALTSLILNQPARRVLLSYSNEGHVDLHELTNRLRPFRSVEIHQIATVGRYRPNQVASSKSKEVVEYLLDIQVNSLQTFF